MLLEIGLIHHAVMMHEFLTKNRGELIERCRLKVAQRPAPRATEEELEHGITLFLDQIIKTLKAEQSTQGAESHRLSGPSGGADAIMSEMGVAAKAHGRELLEHGFTIDQVVHDYGDLCQSVTDLAVELSVPMSNDEFRTLNRCLDNAPCFRAVASDHRFVSKLRERDPLGEALDDSGIH